MRVTIIADASYCDQYKVGGYGFWIASERGKLPGGGAMRGQVQSSTLAEMMAVVNALHTAIIKMLVRREDEILIQTDCLAAIGMLQTTTLAHIDSEHIKVIRSFDKIVMGHKLKVRFKHVKGHTSIREPRYAANRACDQRARNAMRTEREHRKTLTDVNETQ